VNLKQHRPDQILKITDFYIPWTYRNSDKISTLWEDQSATQNLLLNLNYAKSKQSEDTMMTVIVDFPIAENGAVPSTKLLSARKLLQEEKLQVIAPLPD